LAGKPIVAGWNYSWLARLNWTRDSWTAPIDVVRIGPHGDTARAIAKQITNVGRRLHLDPAHPVP
jgi:hypothetical protein